MAIPSRQIGWGTEENLLWQISKQLEYLTGVTYKSLSELAPTYKVYTALLTQSGGDGPSTTYGDETLYKGVTYTITANPSNVDVSSIGAPSNTVGTSFVATREASSEFSGTIEFSFNTGAPVVTVLENTIGNIWWTYDSVGIYNVNSNALFTTNKTYSIPYIYSPLADLPDGIFLENLTVNYSQIISKYNSDNVDGQLSNTPIEIRVYN